MPTLAIFQLNSGAKIKKLKPTGIIPTFLFLDTLLIDGF
jgi:hypothetical protein